MKLKVHIGLRLLIVTIALVTAQYGVVLLALFLPIYLPASLNLSFAKKVGTMLDEDEDEEEDEDKDETKRLLNKVREAARKEVSQHLKAINEEGAKKIEDIVDRKMEIFKDIPINKLKKAVDELEEVNKTVAELKARQQSEETKKEDFFKTKLKEVFPKIRESMLQGKSFRFQLGEENKAPDLINSASFGDRVIFGFREAGVSFAALPELFILDLIQVMTGGPGSNPLSWIERNVHTQTPGPPVIVGNPTPVLEGAQKPQLGYVWVENKVTAETIAAIVPVTKQAVFNYTMLEQEVRFELMRRLAEILQQQIINGNGTSPNLKGINTYAQAFSAGAFAGKVEAANDYDVLVAAAVQVLNNNYVPSAALVSHVARGRMAMAKDSNGAYALPPFVTNGGVQVYGLRVIGTNELTAEGFIVMDPTKSLFNWVENITIEIGYVNDDFEKNIYRLRGELQGMHRIKEHEKLAFVKGNFDTAKAVLETPTA